ncbi:MAG: methyl-accepting chemotaxis protein, partial [Holophagaceae bacterium]|nr:methyl-accepting chemotaxis protein [Holophagaceae bacterium]
MNWYYNLKMKTKLLLGFLLTIILTIWVGAEGMRSIAKISDADIRMYEIGLKSTEHVGVLTSKLQEIRVVLRDAILRTDPEDLRRLKENYDNVWKEYMETAREIVRLFESVGNQPLLAETKKTGASRAEYNRLADNIVNLGIANRNSEAMIAYAHRDITDATVAVLADMTSLNDAIDRTATSLLANNKATAKKAYTTMSITIVGIAIFSILVGTFIANFVVSQLNKLGGFMNRLAHHDLTVESKGEYNDELGAMANDVGKAVTELRGLINHIAQEVEG